LLKEFVKIAEHRFAPFARQQDADEKSGDTRRSAASPFLWHNRGREFARGHFLWSHYDGTPIKHKIRVKTPFDEFSPFRFLNAFYESADGLKGYLVSRIVDLLLWRDSGF
jgi:hypothetical protein